MFFGRVSGSVDVVCKLSVILLTLGCEQGRHRQSLKSAALWIFFLIFFLVGFVNLVHFVCNLFVFSLLVGCSGFFCDLFLVDIVCWGALGCFVLFFFY